MIKFIWPRHMLMAFVLIGFAATVPFDQLSDIDAWVFYLMDHTISMVTLFAVGLYARGAAVRASYVWFALSVGAVFVSFRLYYVVMPDYALLNVWGFPFCNFVGYYVFKRRLYFTMLINQRFGTDIPMRETNFSLLLLTYARWSLTIDLAFACYYTGFSLYYGVYDNVIDAMITMGYPNAAYVRDYLTFFSDCFFIILSWFRLAKDFIHPDALGRGEFMQWVEKGRTIRPYARSAIDERHQF